MTAHGPVDRASGELQTRNLKNTVHNRPRAPSGPLGPGAVDHRHRAGSTPSAQPRFPRVLGPSRCLRSHVELQPLTRSESESGRHPPGRRARPGDSMIQRADSGTRLAGPSLRVRSGVGGATQQSGSAPLESLGYPTAGSASCIRLCLDRHGRVAAMLHRRRRRQLQVIRHSPGDCSVPGPCPIPSLARRCVAGSVRKPGSPARRRAAGPAGVMAKFLSILRNNTVVGIQRVCVFRIRRGLAIIVFSLFILHISYVYIYSNQIFQGQLHQLDFEREHESDIVDAVEFEEYLGNYCNLTGSNRTFAEMYYRSEQKNKEFRFLISLHDPSVDTVVSKGILEGMFGPPGKYPSVDEVHAVCEYGGDYSVNCGDRGVFVEVGSAIGMVSLYAASRGMRVYAFDPLKPNMDRMGESLCVNGAINCVQRSQPIQKRSIAACARKERDRTVTWGSFSPSNFKLHENLVGSVADDEGRTVESMPGNLAATMHGGGSYRSTVRTVTIDDLVPDPVIDLLLLTCQGHEFEVLPPPAPPPAPCCPASPADGPSLRARRRSWARGITSGGGRCATSSGAATSAAPPSTRPPSASRSCCSGSATASSTSRPPAATATPRRSPYWMTRSLRHPPRRLALSSTPVPAPPLTPPPHHHHHHPLCRILPAALNPTQPQRPPAPAPRARL